MKTGRVSLLWPPLWEATKKTVAALMLSLSRINWGLKAEWETAARTLEKREFQESYKACDCEFHTIATWIEKEGGGQAALDGIMFFLKKISIATTDLPADASQDGSDSDGEDRRGVTTARVKIGVMKAVLRRVQESGELSLQGFAEQGELEEVI